MLDVHFKMDSVDNKPASSLVLHTMYLVLNVKNVSCEFSWKRRFLGEGERAMEKRSKIELLSFFRGREQRKKDRKIAKRPENSTIKPLSSISVPSMKIQGGHGPRPWMPFCYLLVKCEDR